MIGEGPINGIRGAPKIGITFTPMGIPPFFGREATGGIEGAYIGCEIGESS